MNREATRPKLPTFVNIYDLKETPQDPVILYFTKAEWSDFISRQRVLKRSKLALSQFQMQYQLAPWGNGDVIIYPNPVFDGKLRLECKPILKVIVQRDPIDLRLIQVGYECRVKYCITYIEAYPDEIPEGVNGIGCDDTHCRGGCREIFVGTQTDGHFTCACGG